MKMKTWNPRGLGRRAGPLALVVAVAWMTARCGGTTGREGLGLDGPAAVEEAGAVEALDAGLFDVVVPYADHIIPDVHPPPDAGGGWRWPFPQCPPYIPVLPDGERAPLSDAGSYGAAVDEVPGALISGQWVFAPDGSVCATYPWLGSKAVDRCMTVSGDDFGMIPGFIDLPPCNWAVDAGLATAGSGAGTPRFDLCLGLYQCILENCRADLNRCLCGVGANGQTKDGNACIKAPTGPCLDQVLAAFEMDPNDKDSVGNTLKDLGQVELVAGKLATVFSIAQQGGCFADGGK